MYRLKTFSSVQDYKDCTSVLTLFVDELLAVSKFGPVFVMAQKNEKYCFAIDRGGTFTDVYCLCPGGRVRTKKLLSVDPSNYKDAPVEGIRRILSAVQTTVQSYKRTNLYVLE